MTENNFKTADLIKSRRLAKGYTQLQLAELTRVSLRSIQRIESGKVIPRLYTLQVLAKQLGIELEQVAINNSNTNPTVVKNNIPKKIILSVGTAITLVLFAAAFLSQTANFPETNFEYFLFWGFICVCYIVLLLKFWK